MAVIFAGFCKKNGGFVDSSGGWKRVFIIVYIVMCSLLKETNIGLVVNIKNIGPSLKMK